jgi:hypothetical protein
MADIERDIVLRVKSETDQAQGQFKNLKQELRSIENELNKMAEAGQTGTAAFNKLQQRAGEVKDQIGDTKNAIKALSSDTFKLDAFAQGAQGIAGGFAAAQGAMALFGSENKAVEEAIKKTQGAMALLQGVTAITNILQKDSAFSLAFLSKAQTENAVATNVATTATKGFSRALIATGIGAIIVLIGTLVAYWDDLKEAVGGVSKETENYIEKSKLDTEQAEKKYNLTKDTENVLKLQGKSQREILNIKIKETDAIIIGIKNQIKGQQMATKQAVEASKRNQEIAKGVIMALFSPIKALTLMVDGLINGLIETANFFGADIDFKLNLSSFDQLLAETIFDPEKVAEEGKKTEEELQKSLDKITNEQAGFKLEVQKLDEEDKKKREEAEKKAREAEEKARKDKEQKDEELKKKLEQNAKDFQDRTNKEYEDSKKSSDAYYDHLINNAKLNGQSTEELELQKLQNLLQIQKDYGLSTVEIEDQIALKKKEISDKEKERKVKEFEKTITDDSVSLVERLRLNKEFYDKKLIDEKTYKANAEKLEKDLFQKRKATAMEWAQVTKDGLDALVALNEAFSSKDKEGQRKSFERDKKFKIASAITATAMGVAQQLAVPQDQITGLNFAKAAIVLATGIAQIKKISDTKFEGGGSAPNNNIGANVPTQPSQNSQNTPGINSTMLNLDAQGNLRQGPTRTYVVESEISDKQRRSRQLSQTAILGK